MTAKPRRPSINLGTILLEPSRWARPKRATYAVIDWADRIRKAGFDGIEVWELHALNAALSSRQPIIFNTYCGFDDESSSERWMAWQAATGFRARGVKFNVGGDEERLEEYGRNLHKWIDKLPNTIRPLCECHAGTVVETPTAARVFFDAAGVDCGIIVHAFSDTEERLREWLTLFGSSVELVHVQLRDDAGRFIRLDEAPELAKRRISILRDAGFTGSYTLEFTKGTGTADDRPEVLWEHALSDLAFLREHA